MLSPTSVRAASRRTPLARAALAVALNLGMYASAHAADPADDAGRADDAHTLDTLKVSGQRNARSYTPGNSSAATGLSLTQRQTPQSVTVIGRQQMDDQQIESIQDALTSTTGITTSSQDNAGRTSFRARGFEITNYKVDGMQVDGQTSSSGLGASMNLDLYDSVQVVRGANGLLGGTGDPSATIYLERKRPLREFGGSAALTAGSWDKRRAMGDISVPVTADGSVRARLVASGEDSGSFRDRESLDRFGGLANIEADLGPSTRLDAGLQYESSRNGGASWGSNVPIWFADGSRAHLPRSTNPVADWSVSKRDATTAFAKLEQDIGQWQVRLGYAHMHSNAYTNAAVAKVNNAATGFGGFWNADGSGAMLNALHSEYEGSRDNVDLSLSGPFRLFGREHQLMAGFNGYRDELTTYTFSNALGNCGILGVRPYNGCQYRAIGLPIDDWRTWDGSYADFDTHRTRARTLDTTLNYGGYLAGRFSLADPLTLVLGSRIGNYKTYSRSYTINDVGTRSPASGVQQQVTPYAGLLFDFAGHYTAYASYTDIFTPQGNLRDADNALLDPVTGKSFELGLKGEFGDGAVNASLALFRNQQDNVAESTGAANPVTGETIYRAVDGVSSKGAELEISGQLTADWNLSAGYTWLKVDGLTYRKDPKQLLRLFTTYSLPGAWNRLTVGGGVSVQSSTEWATNPGRPLGNGRYDASNLRLGGYALVDLMARYQLDERWQLSLNLSNVTDRVYYSQFGFYDGLIYGEPRAANVTVRMNF